MQVSAQQKILQHIGGMPSTLPSRHNSLSPVAIAHRTPVVVAVPCLLVCFTVSFAVLVGPFFFYCVMFVLSIGGGTCTLDGGRSFSIFQDQKCEPWLFSMKNDHTTASSCMVPTATSGFFIQSWDFRLSIPLIWSDSASVSCTAG